jgi:hypothetical protein
MLTVDGQVKDRVEGLGIGATTTFRSAVTSPSSCAHPCPRSPPGDLVAPDARPRRPAARSVASDRHWSRPPLVPQPRGARGPEVLLAGPCSVVPAEGTLERVWDEAPGLFGQAVRTTIGRLARRPRRFHPRPDCLDRAQQGQRPSEDHGSAETRRDIRQLPLRVACRQHVAGVRVDSDLLRSLDRVVGGEDGRGRRDGVA